MNQYLLLAIIAVLAIMVIGCVVNNLAKGQEQQQGNLNAQFLETFNKITEKTLLNYTLVTHVDQSVTLYAFLPNATIGPDGLPDAMRPIVGYSNSNALVGPNGVEEVLMKLAKSWNVNEIKENLRKK